MKKLALAAFVAAIPFSGMAAEHEEMDMDATLTMLETLVGNTLTEYNIEADPRELTINQLATIHGIANSDEDEGGKANAIEAVVAE